MAYKMKYKGYIGKTKSPMKESFRQAKNPGLPSFI